MEILQGIFKAGISVRFTKNPEFYERAAKYLKTGDLEKIASFVNGSNSKVSTAYWVCRDLDLSKQKEYKKRFIESAYTNISRNETARKINLKTGNSFGYCGWTEIMPNGKKYYCRSTPEYVFVNWYFSFYPTGNLKYEQKLFLFSNFNYKPDFFEYDNKEKLIKIYEIKSDDRFLLDEKYPIIKDYFKSIKIDYDVVYDIDDKIKQVDGLAERIDGWKLNSNIQNNCAGEKNPRYCGKTDQEIEDIIRRELKKVNDLLDTRHYMSIAEKFKLPKSFSKFRKISLSKIIDELNEEKGYPKFKNWQERREYRKHL